MKANTFWIAWIYYFFFKYLKLGKVVLFVTDAFWFKNTELEDVVSVYE